MNGPLAAGVIATIAQFKIRVSASQQPWLDAFDFPAIIFRGRKHRLATMAISADDHRRRKYLKIATVRQ